MRSNGCQLEKGMNWNFSPFMVKVCSYICTMQGCEGVDDKIAGKKQIKEWKDKFAYTVDSTAQQFIALPQSLVSIKTPPQVHISHPTITVEVSVSQSNFTAVLIPPDRDQRFSHLYATGRGGLSIILTRLVAYTSIFGTTRWLPFPFLCPCSCLQVGVNTGMVKRVIFSTFLSLGKHIWGGHWSHMRTAHQTSNMITSCGQQLYIFESVSQTEPRSPTSFSQG